MEKFSDSQLAFECNIPNGWQVLPAPWAKKFQLSASSTSEELCETLKEADSPFFSMYLPQHNPMVTIPMVQGTVKPAATIRQLGGLGGALDISVAQMEKTFPDFRVIRRLDTYLVAGVAGVYLKASMSVLNESGARFFSASELILLKTARYCFMIGLSGSAYAEFRPQEDFDAIIRSIRVS
jgi:hypothetical protein